MRGLHARRIHIAFALAASLSLAGFQEETEIARWIDDLGHDEIARRDQAQTQLLKAGAAAMPALRKAIESGRFKGEPENRARLEKVHRLVGEVVHDADQRRWSLALVTFDAEETALGDALKEIEKVKQCVFESSVDPKRKVRIRGRDLPYRQVMDSIEDQLDISFRAGEGANARAFFVKSGRPKRSPRAYWPGFTLDAVRTAFMKDGKRAGWSLRLLVEESGLAYLDKVQVHDMDGREWPVELCLRCGNKALLKSDSKEAFRVTVEGDLVWTSNYGFDVADPSKRQEFRVGDFTMTYDLLKLQMARSSSTHDRLNPKLWLGVDSKSRGFLGFSGGESLIESGDYEHAAWCEGGPRAHRPPDYRCVQSDIDFDPKHEIKLADIKSVEVGFGKPIRETFKVTLTVPAE